MTPCSPPSSEISPKLPTGEGFVMVETEDLHELEKLIARRKSAQEANAVAQAEATRKADDLAGKVKVATSEVEQALRVEIAKASAAIKRSGCDEKFVFKLDSPNGAEWSANLILSGNTGPLRGYALDAAEGKIVIKSAGMTMQIKITNVFQVQLQDWNDLLTKMYEAST
jgi:hypothetical protein